MGVGLWVWNQGPLLLWSRVGVFDANVKVKLFAARLIDLSCQTGFEKHSIFKLKAEFKSLQPLCLWEGGSPWMGGCKQYWRVEFLNISQDQLWQDVEIRKCSCHWCWYICWKYTLCSVHRARPWASPHDVALGSSPSLNIPPHQDLITPESWCLLARLCVYCPCQHFLAFSVAHLCPHIQSPMGSSFLWIFRLCKQKKKANSSARLSTTAEKGAGKTSGNLRLFSPSPEHHLHYSLENLPCFRTQSQVLLGKERLFSSVNFPVTFPCCLEGAVRARYLPYIKLYRGCREGRWKCN